MEVLSEYIKKSQTWSIRIKIRRNTKEKKKLRKTMFLDAPPTSYYLTSKMPSRSTLEFNRKM